MSKELIVLPVDRVWSCGERKTQGGVPILCNGKYYGELPDGVAQKYVEDRNMEMVEAIIGKGGRWYTRENETGEGWNIYVKPMCYSAACEVSPPDAAFLVRAANFYEQVFGVSSTTTESPTKRLDDTPTVATEPDKKTALELPLLWFRQDGRYVLTDAEGRVITDKLTVETYSRILSAFTPNVILSSPFKKEDLKQLQHKEITVHTLIESACFEEDEDDEDADVGDYEEDEE